jgi:hypothetical protein
MEPNIFSNELVGKAGGILISDIINGDQVVFLGKSNIPKRANEYEGFGGKWEPQDISSLHTALREMIEEFFNLKTSTEFINQLAIQIVNSDIIIKRVELHGMSYLINLTGLDWIFARLVQVVPELAKYQTSDNKFNWALYIGERVVTAIASDGLNEIQSIHICKLSDIRKRKFDLRWFTSKIIYEMIVKT